MRPGLLRSSQRRQHVLSLRGTKQSRKKENDNLKCTPVAFIISGCRCLISNRKSRTATLYSINFISLSSAPQNNISPIGVKKIGRNKKCCIFVVQIAGNFGVKCDLKRHIRIAFLLYSCSRNVRSFRSYARNKCGRSLLCGLTYLYNGYFSQPHRRIKAYRFMQNTDYKRKSPPFTSSG